MQIKKLLGLRSDDFHHIGIDLRCRGNDFALGEVIAFAGEIGHDGARLHERSKLLRRYPKS